MDKVKKRDRSVNFKREETALLLSLIEPRIKCIENKKSDAVTWHVKEKTWLAIEQEFNKLTRGIHRGAKHLKLKYEALKRDARKKACIMRRGRCLPITEHVALIPPCSSSDEVCLSAAEKKVFNMLLQNSDSDLSDGSQICSLEVTPSVEFVCPEMDAKESTENKSPNEQNNEMYNNKCNTGVFDKNDSEDTCQEEEALLNTANYLYTKEELCHEEDEGPLNTADDYLCTNGKQKKKRKLETLIESVTDMVILKKNIMEEEMSEKLLQKKTADEELQHRREMRELEKQHMLLKIEILKAELENTKGKV